MSSNAKPTVKLQSVIDYAIQTAKNCIDEDGDVHMEMVEESILDWFGLDSWEYEERYGKPVLEALEDEGLV